MENKTVAEVIEVMSKPGGCVCSMIAKYLGRKDENDKDCDTMSCHDCYSKWLGILADMVEREKAEAIHSAIDTSLGAAISVVAEENGWPKPRESEGATKYIDRCFLPRQLFEDGEPVQIGDKVLNYDRERTVDNIAVAVYGTECLLLAFVDSPEKRLKRTAPKALDADGAPIEVGDTVHIDESHASKAANYDFNAGPESFGLLGVSPNDALVVANAEHFTCGHRFVLFKGEDRAWCPASWLTHKEPDTQERINDDATINPFAYCVAHGLANGYHDKSEATELMMLDLLRRQRELGARMGGE